MHSIYLDYAAASPVDPEVLQAMQPYFTEFFYNASALYGASQKVKRDLEAARAVIAGIVGSRPVEINFTAGGTEANNIAIHGVMRAFPGAKIVVSAMEHDSVLQTAAQYDYIEAAITEQGMVDVEALAAVIDDQSVLVSVMLANNEIGTIQPIRQITELVSRIREDRRKRNIELPIYVHTDAAQAANYLDIHVSRLGVDLMSLNGGKIYGPKQTGVLYVKAGTKLKPLIAGGGQEHGVRSGTENVAGAVGFSFALQKAQNMRDTETHRLKDLQSRFISGLKDAIPEVVINGGMKKRLPNNVHITIPGQDNERLLFALDEQGIQAAAGSACSASQEESSHVLHALGLSDEAARSSLRFTMGRSTTPEDIDTTIEVLRSILA